MPKVPKVSKKNSKPSQQQRETINTILESQTFEEELRVVASQRVVDAPSESVDAAPPSNAPPHPESDAEFDEQLVDNFDGIDWKRLQSYMKPLRTQKHKKSWIYKYGYRVCLRSNPERIFFICRHCHQQKIIDAGGQGKYEVTLSTSTAAAHLQSNRRGHNYTPSGQQRPHLPYGQRTLRGLTINGIKIPQDVGNAMGNFNVQAFRLAAVGWLVENNHPLREFETPAFQALIGAANPEALDALWKSHKSVTQYTLRLFDYLLPKVREELSKSLTKIHISFDGWTVKSGKKAFCGVVAHYVDINGQLKDLPLALPQLSGSHSGERIAQVILQIFEKFGISPSNVGYFVLDNAGSNNTAVESIAETYGFNPLHRRLRCGPHTINLAGQTIIFGVNKESFGNKESQFEQERQFLQEWRQEGPLGVLINVLNYIKTPQQYDLIRSFQQDEEGLLASQKASKPKEIIKPVITRWNSFCAAFERATEMPQALNAYIQYHIEKTRTEEAFRRARGLRPEEVPSWMKSDGLTSQDWAVITQYIQVLMPLKEATARLEGRGASGRFGAIHEIIPTFEAILQAYERLSEQFSFVNFNELDAPEDHLAINVRAGWKKLEKYYRKLEDSPAYYAATILHPYYKFYCDNSWRGQPRWLEKADAQFQDLWAGYKGGQGGPSPPRKNAQIATNLQEQIDKYANPAPLGNRDVRGDEFTRWKYEEPNLPWDHPFSINPISYWIAYRHKYPKLSQLALDVLSIPASSCECERQFSELGDLLEPRRAKLSPQVLSAIQSVRCWLKAGFNRPPELSSIPESTLESLNSVYQLYDWTTDD